MNMKPIALVTGASSGIGQAISVRLAQDGYHILVHYNQNLSGAQKTLEQIKNISATGMPGTGDMIQFDITQCQSIQDRLDAYFTQTDSPLSVLVNNAGQHNDTLTGLMSDAQFDQVIQTNLYGPFYLMRWSIKKMLSKRSGCIVNMSSLSGQIGNPGQINYAASKGALIAMTKTLASEVGSRGIRVNAVAPGLIETEMTGSISTPHLDAIKSRIPLKRLGKPEEVAGAVSFLCSKDSSYITGHTLSINGGLFPS